MTSSQLTILVLTDHRTHKLGNTIHPLVRHMAMHPRVRKVYIACRGDIENRAFFNASPVMDLSCTEVTADYTMETLNLCPKRRILINSFDAVLFRLDDQPEDPVTDSFLMYCAEIFAGKVMVNNPIGMIQTNTKKFLIEVQDMLGNLLPPSRLCRNIQDLKDFQDQPNMVLKALKGFGGKGVARFRQDGNGEIASYKDAATFIRKNGGSVLAMEYLNPSLPQSDNRIVVVDGEIVCSGARSAAKGDWRCNITSGGNVKAIEISNREREMVRLLDPILNHLGIYFYGLDTLLDNRNRRVLSEINTLNVGLVHQIELATGKSHVHTLANKLVQDIEINRARGEPSIRSYEEKRALIGSRFGQIH